MNLSKLLEITVAQASPIINIKIFLKNDLCMKGRAKPPIHDQRVTIDANKNPRPQAI